MFLIKLFSYFFSPPVLEAKYISSKNISDAIK